MFHVDERTGGTPEIGKRRSSIVEKSKTANKSAELPYAHDPRWLLVERILATPDFERSPRLSEFLRHICQLALEGRSRDINEQYLGEIVFGRKAIRRVDEEAGDKADSAKRDEIGPLAQSSIEGIDTDEQHERIERKKIACEQRSAKR